MAHEGCRMQAAGLLEASSHISEAKWVSPQKSTPADKKSFLWPNKSLFDSCGILNYFLPLPPFL